MKPVIRYQTQLLFRKSYKPVRIIRIRPTHKATSVVRPARAGPQFNKYEYATHSIRVCPNGRQGQSA